MRRRGLAVAITAVVFFSQIAGVAASTRGLAAPAAAPHAAPVDRALQRELAAGHAHRIVVEFKGKADLRAASSIKDRTARSQAVVNALTATATSAQRGAKATAAKAKGISATTYWLSNVMVVNGSSAALSALASTLAKDANVTSIRAEKIYPLVKPLDPKVAILAAAGDPEWGVAKIRADVAWDHGILGQGVVVASIDTGVDYTHPALVEHYRGNNHDGTFSHDYNWWDPSHTCEDAAPCDNVAHGTHTMGTMVGGDGPGPFTPDTGVAPGAEWIAAKGCEDLGCSESSLLSSGQWVIAPTDLLGNNPLPALHPDIVNNSWGSGPNDPFYQATVAAWRAAGIIPVFASGNPGPFCGEGGSPGDYLSFVQRRGHRRERPHRRLLRSGPVGLRQGEPGRLGAGRRRRLQRPGRRLRGVLRNVDGDAARGRHPGPRPVGRPQPPRQRRRGAQHRPVDRGRPARRQLRR